jgi:hypothetical protein
MSESILEELTDKINNSEELTDDEVSIFFNLSKNRKVFVVNRFFAYELEKKIGCPATICKGACRDCDKFKELKQTIEEKKSEERRDAE